MRKKKVIENKEALKEMFCSDDATQELAVILLKQYTDKEAYSFLKEMLSEVSMETPASWIWAGMMCKFPNRFKVRFNLSRGKNYKKWKVEELDGTVEYIDPKKYAFFLSGCKVRNQKKTAERIYSGEPKSVCAWIEATGMYKMELSDNTYFSLEKTKEIHYNPKKAPHWVLDDKDVDGEYFGSLVLHQEKVYKIF
jgi:hypothetical protein